MEILGSASNKNDDGPFSWNVPPYHPSTIKYSFSKVCPDDKGGVGMNIMCPVEVQLQPEGTLPDIQTTDAAKEFLRDHNNSNPFFLAVGFHKPHISLKFPRKYLGTKLIKKLTLDYIIFFKTFIHW
jgi:iduronate 2-sulfatase